MNIKIRFICISEYNVAGGRVIPVCCSVKKFDEPDTENNENSSFVDDRVVVMSIKPFSAMAGV